MRCYYIITVQTNNNIMAKRIYTPEEKTRKETAKLYGVCKNKVWNLKEEDFSIDLLTLQWKHSTWNTWAVGAENYDETKNLIRKYIAEWAKPYATRDLTWVHLA